MGREAVTLRATATVSKHNSPQDDEDAARWNWFAARVRMLAEQAEQFGFTIDVTAEELDIHGW